MGRALISMILAMAISGAGVIIAEPGPVIQDCTVVKPTIEDDRHLAPVVPESPDPVMVLARVTAYAPFDNVSGICADEDPTVTSVGHRPGPQYVAVDPKRIPYGTRLRIPGYGEVIAGDTGGALRQYDGIAIDVFMDTYEDAIQWGVQYIEVEIIEEDQSE